MKLSRNGDYVDIILVVSLAVLVSWLAWPCRVERGGLCTNVQSGKLKGSVSLCHLYNSA